MARPEKWSENEYREMYNRHKLDQLAASLLSPEQPCCCERLAGGWFDAGCKYHRPVRSWKKDYATP